MGKHYSPLLRGQHFENHWYNVHIFNTGISYSGGKFNSSVVAGKKKKNLLLQWFVVFQRAIVNKQIHSIFAGLQFHRKRVDLEGKKVYKGFLTGGGWRMGL